MNLSAREKVKINDFDSIYRRGQLSVRSENYALAWVSWSETADQA
jgi:hypothetical protein